VHLIYNRIKDDPSRYGELMVTPITLDRVKEVTWLDEMRAELLREAKKMETISKESLVI
jgi:hypothetical protein